MSVTKIGGALRCAKQVTALVFQVQDKEDMSLAASQLTAQAFLEQDQ